MSTTEAVGGRNRTDRPEDLGNAPRPSSHAELRWLQRTGLFDLSLQQAWSEGYHVGNVTSGGAARLHPPTRTLLPSLNGVITTVLDADLREYTADHLMECGTCNLEFQPRHGDRQCPWCGHNNRKVVE